MSDHHHQDPIDLPALRTVCMDREELTQKLLGQLLLQAPTWQAELEQAATACNFEQIRFVCHTVCGAAAALRADRMGNAAARLGTQIRANDFTNFQTALQETVAAIVEAKAFASEYLN